MIMEGDKECLTEEVIVTGTGLCLCGIGGDEDI